MKTCVEKFDELKKASDVFLNKTIPKFEEVFEKIFAKINDTRTKLACMACDPAAFQSYNLKSKTVRITRADYEDYAKAVLEYHFIRYNELLDYIKLYANYVILVQPAANILLDDYDNKIKIVEKVTKECYEASKDNKDFDF